jgi:uncharacterized protein YbjT (DUF2867 family)
MSPSAPEVPTEPRRVVIAGANGYIGRRLARCLLARGHPVTAFVRATPRAPAGCDVVSGDALDESAFLAATRGAHTLVHLVGVAHPSPAKAALFERIDLGSAQVAARAALANQVRHIVYVSVARPAPVMQAYIKARRRAEEAFAATNIPCTFLQPWYVLGPGHRWPLALVPLYKILELLPATRATAERLGLLRITTLLRCLVEAIEHPPQGVRSWDVPAMRRMAREREASGRA